MLYQVIIDKTIYINSSNIEKVCINIDSKKEHTTSTNLLIVARGLKQQDIDSLITTKKQDVNNLTMLKQQEIKIIKYYPNGDRMVYQFMLAILTNYTEDYGVYCNGDIKSVLSFEQQLKKLEVYFFPKNFNSLESKLLQDIEKIIEKNNVNKSKIITEEKVEEIAHMDNSIKGEKRKLEAIIVDYETNAESKLEDITTYSIIYTGNNIIVTLIGVLTDKTPNIIKKIKTKNLNEGFSLGLKVGKFTTEIERKKYQEIQQGASTNSGAIKIDTESFGINVIKYDEKYEQITGMNFFCMTLEK